MKVKRYTTLRQLFSYILHITKPFYLNLAAVFILVAIEAFILAALLPQTIENVADITRSATDSHALFVALRWQLFFFLVLQGILEINLRLQDYFFSIKTVPSLTKSIYHNHFSRLLKQSYQFYQHNPPGVISNNLNRLANAIPEIIESFVLKITFFILTFFVAAVSLWRVASFAGACLACYLCFMAVAISFFNKKINDRTAQWTNKRSRMIARVLDVISNIFTIKIFSSRHKEKKGFHKILDKTWQAERNVEYAYFKMFVVLGVGYLLLQALSIYFLVEKTAAGIISVGKLMGVLYLNETVVSLIWDDLPDLLAFSKHVGKAKQALAFSQVPVRVQDKPNARRLVVKRGDIVFDHVCFGFSAREKPFFSDLNLTIPAGQKVGIVGHTGSGKSTLIKILLRLYDIDKGAIRIDGQNIADVTQDSLRRNIGFIPQDISMLQRSLRENLQYGHQRVNHKKMVQAAQQACIHDFIMSTERGYDSLVGEEGIAPSGGERQRLSIARFLLKKPSIVLMDEATSQLDAITEKRIQDVLNAFSQGRTTLIIAHRLKTLLQVDRIIVIDKGKVVEDGTHDALLAQGGLYTHFWQTQADGFIQLSKS